MPLHSRIPGQLKSVYGIPGQPSDIVTRCMEWESDRSKRCWMKAALVNWHLVIPAVSPYGMGLWDTEAMIAHSQCAVNFLEQSNAAHVPVNRGHQSLAGHTFALRCLATTTTNSEQSIDRQGWYPIHWSRYHWYFCRGGDMVSQALLVIKWIPLQLCSTNTQICIKCAAF